MNVDTGNESTLLHFTAANGTDAHILVDAGADVDLDETLGDDEYLNAICLTHAHIDHYRSLAQNHRHNAPIYTAADTATVLRRAFPEIAQHETLGDVDSALDALTPIDDWTSILDTLAVRPVSVGHTPGAVGFLFRVTDETLDGELTPSTKYVLATGDFTTRPCAGYAGLTDELPVDVDALLLNVATRDDYQTTLDDVLEIILERAYGGSRTVVATSALTGVHVGVLLDSLVDEIGHTVPIRLVGQTAKHYHNLDYDCPHVTATPTFDAPSDVLEPGTITIGGPETATTGSTERLLQAIDEDAGAAFVQLTTGSGTPVSTTACSTYHATLINHPSSVCIDEFVAALAPTQVVVKHASGRTLNRFQKRFDRCFTWGTDDEHRHTLYADGEWTAPGWLHEDTIQRIRMRHRDAEQDQSPISDASFSSLTHDDVNPAAEGVDVDYFVERFAGTDATTESPTEPTADDSIRATGERPQPQDEPTEPTSESFEDAVLSRLDTIEAQLSEDDRHVTARVLSSDGDTFLQVLDDVDLEPGDVVNLQITHPETETESSGE
ncbi:MULTISPECIES: MBL fold metallo-hydrolase [Halarchaeum]|uniref:MBL fold metallo-hydrolase n=1 Tax=Halarchaeum TaxID=744724 RepID=UPI000B232FA6|nr:MBL fold metallo-hydrolase [Halarchaeum acidiphilum]